MDQRVVGIDLGTTFSAIAYVDEAGRAEAIPNAGGELTTPSVVLLDGDTVEVGQVAVNQWVTNADHVVRCIKRAMGLSDYTFQDRTPVQISAAIIAALCADAEAFFVEPVREAVITCPAYFNAVEVENTRLAGEQAGLTVKQIIREPVAAAVHYGVEHMRDGEVVIVCDLGGGTYDATVLKLSGGRFEPLATMGSRSLGGHDWTMELVELVGERYLAEHGVDPQDELATAQMLYDSCETAKRSFSQSASVTIPVVCGGRQEFIEVTRDEFESRTEWKIEEVIEWTRQARDKAGFETWEPVDTVLMVGGSSRLTRLKPALWDETGHEPVLSAQPDLAIALGAAILAKGEVRPRRRGALREKGGGLVEVVQRNTVPRSLGTRVLVTDVGVRLENAAIIPYGSEVPCSCSREDFAVPADGAEFVNIPILEFDDLADDQLLFNYRCRCLPNSRRGQPVRVTFSYDANGAIGVQAEDVESGQALALDKAAYEEPDLEELASGGAGPGWVVFAVDVSYSMDGFGKMENACRGVLDTARELFDAGGYEVGLVSFSSSATACCQPTTDYGELEQAVGGLSPQSTTAMDLGLLKALDMVAGAPAGCLKVIVLVTDGMPDDGRRDSTLDAAARCRREADQLCVLGIGSQDVDAGYLGNISTESLVIEANQSIGAGLSSLLALG